MLLSNIPDMCFSTEIAVVEVATDTKILMTVSIGGDTPYSEILYPVAGKVTIFNLDEIINEELSARGLPVASITVAAKNPTNLQVLASRVVRVVHCSRLPMVGGTAADWCAEHFLTVDEFRRVPPGLPLSACLCVPGASIMPAVRVQFKGHVAATGEILSGSGFYATVSSAGDSHTWLCEVDFDRILEALRATGGLGDGAFEFDTVSLSCADRELHFFIDPELSLQEVFSFRSCFNVEELIAWPGDSVASVAVTQQEATLPGTTIQYDRSFIKSYKLSWPMVHTSMRLFIEDFLCSPVIARFAPPSQLPRDGIAASMPVIITDFKFDSSARDFSAAEFTYRFAVNRPVTSMLRLNGRVFNFSYNPKFS